MQTVVLSSHSTSVLQDSNLRHPEPHTKVGTLSLTESRAIRTSAPRTVTSRIDSCSISLPNMRRAWASV